MKALPACLLVLTLFSACKKANNPDTKTDPGPFYIRFKLNDSTYNYQAVGEYIFGQGRGTSSDAGGNNEYFPVTWINPLKGPYSNVGFYYSIGFVFSYTPPCANCFPPDWVSYGNALFVTGDRHLCYTGINYVAQTLQLSCSENNGVTLFFNAADFNLYNSGSGVQPPSSYYTIDTVTNYRSRSATNSNYNYDKIVSGRFACRMFNPENLAEYYDLTLGEFRMPVWLNDAY